MKLTSAHPTDRRGPGFLVMIGTLIIASGHVFVDGRECTSQSAMGTVKLHHNDSVRNSACPFVRDK